MRPELSGPADCPGAAKIRASHSRGCEPLSGRPYLQCVPREMKKSGNRDTPIRASSTAEPNQRYTPEERFQPLVQWNPTRNTPPEHAVSGGGFGSSWVPGDLRLFVRRELSGRADCPGAAKMRASHSRGCEPPSGRPYLQRVPREIKKRTPSLCGDPGNRDTLIRAACLPSQFMAARINPPVACTTRPAPLLASVSRSPALAGVLGGESQHSRGFMKPNWIPETARSNPDRRFLQQAWCLGLHDIQQISVSQGPTGVN